MASLAVLLGRPPENFKVEGTPLESLNEPKVAAGLPSDLLRRRPDVFTAEANLESASSDLVAARAALFPSLTLTASGGVQNPALNAAVISLERRGTHLEFGCGARPAHIRRRQAARRAGASASQAAGSWPRAIERRSLPRSSTSRIPSPPSSIWMPLASFKTKAWNRASALSTALDFATNKEPETSLSVLEAQRTLYAVRDQYIQYRLARLQALVSLCKALGGGWQAPDAAAQPQAAALQAAPRPEFRGPSSSRNHHRCTSTVRYRDRPAPRGAAHGRARD